MSIEEKTELPVYLIKSVLFYCFLLSFEDLTNLMSLNIISILHQEIRNKIKLYLLYSFILGFLFVCLFMNITV